MSPRKTTSLILSLTRLLEHIPGPTVGAYELNVFQTMKNRSRKSEGRIFSFYISSNHLFYFFSLIWFCRSWKFSTVFIFQTDVSLLTCKLFKLTKLQLSTNHCSVCPLYSGLNFSHSSPSRVYSPISASSWKKTSVEARMRFVSLLIGQTSRQEMLGARIRNYAGSGDECDSFQNACH